MAYTVKCDMCDFEQKCHLLQDVDYITLQHIHRYAHIRNCLAVMEGAKK